MRMIPRVPNNYFTINGYEDNKIKRVCMSKSIDEALMTMSKNIENAELYEWSYRKTNDITVVRKYMCTI